MKTVSTLAFTSVCICINYLILHLQLCMSFPSPRQIILVVPTALSYIEEEYNNTLNNNMIQQNKDTDQIIPDIHHLLDDPQVVCPG